MPKYEVRLGRISRIYERAYITVEADDDYHAKALALEIDEDDMDWHSYDSETDVEVEACREVKDDQA